MDFRRSDVLLIHIYFYCTATSHHRGNWVLPRRRRSCLHLSGARFRIRRHLRFSSSIDQWVIIVGIIVVVSACQPCTPGYYSEGENEDCMPCSGGTYSSTFMTGICSVCPPGTFALPGSSNCTECPVGVYEKSFDEHLWKIAESGDNRHFLQFSQVFNKRLVPNMITLRTAELSNWSLLAFYLSNQLH